MTVLSVLHWICIKELSVYDTSNHCFVTCCIQTTTTGKEEAQMVHLIVILMKNALQCKPIFAITTATSKSGASLCDCNTVTNQITEVFVNLCVRRETESGSVPPMCCRHTVTVTGEECNKQPPSSQFKHMYMPMYMIWADPVTRYHASYLR